MKPGQRLVSWKKERSLQENCCQMQYTQRQLGALECRVERQKAAHSMSNSCMATMLLSTVDAAWLMVQRLAVLTLTSSVTSLLQVSPMKVTMEQRVQHAVAALKVLCQVLLDTWVHLPALVVSLRGHQASFRLLRFI